ncbi:uncharacterized protein L3040_002067 [Drepanopeziza brunnea f. sp. 'multigermtubi']|uniref:uncharacterized protein n=1 Tax=Drepanopeziza brunnea f. sp. 'multigermtubi' TaxID=698441 RepID=UPI00239E022D|nr:hypothetical protein L3040_002067 [Drepanopeziza brunnea f. sp. 'multigermtubi']
MSAPEEPVIVPTIFEQNTILNCQPEPNPDLPARTIVMAGDKRHEQTSSHKEDPATMAASEELKHTTISDKAAAPRVHDPADVPAAEDKVMQENAKVSTPELEAEAEHADSQDEDLRERLSSPKKKRGRDADEDAQDSGDDVDEPGSSADGSVANGNRMTRSGPEKKRPRDTSEELSKSAEKSTEAAPEKVSADLKVTDEETAKSPTKEIPAPKTSASAFASSGFASLAASSSSPFGSIGAAKPSIFSSGTQPATSGFGALSGTKLASSASTTSGFGLASGDKPASGFGFGGGVSSGFAGLASGSVFGANSGNGFGGGSGAKLSSFAAPPGKDDESLSSKPARAFGAPDSDEDDGADVDDSDGGAVTDDEESAPAVHEEKKKGKPSKVDDGEAGEATLLQVRAKLFAIESKEVGWKERGVGTLKINVPKSCVSFDDNGVPIPGSFDASGLEDDDEGATGPRVARLIMRQENTHRVVLNTVIVRAMEFKDKPSTSAAQIIFTAFEGDKEPTPINMLLRMSEANARIFRTELASVQHAL